MPTATVRLPVRFGLALALVAILFPGCGGDGDDEWLLRYDGLNEDDALLQATLVRAGDCPYGVTPACVDIPPKRVLLVFPRQRVSWDEDAQSLTVDGETVAVGEVGHWSGSGTEGGQAGGLDPGVSTDCTFDELWFVGY